MDAKEQQRKFVDDEIRKRHQDLQELDQEFLEKRPELDNLKKEIGEKTRTLEDLRDQIRKWNETVEKRKSEIGQYGEARNVVGSRESTACGVEETDVGPGSNYEEKHRQCRERIKHDEDRLAAMKGTLSKLEEEQYRVSAAAYVTLWGSWALSKEGWKRAEALARFASTKAVEVARDWERFETEQSVMQKVWLECEESRQRGERARERYELLFKGLQSKEEEAERCLDQLENRERELAERGKRLSGEELKLERRAAELDELSCQMTRERDRQDAILKQQVKDNENTLRNERDSLQREKTKLQEQIETQTAQLNQDREALQKEQERIDRLRAEAEKKMFDASERETGVNAIVDRAKKAQDEWATERAAQKTATDRVNKDLDGRSRQIEKQESDLHKKQAKLETDSQSFVDVQTSCTAEMKTQADLIKVFLGLKKEVKKEVRKMAWPKQSTKTGDLNSFLVELKTATKTLQDALEEFAENIGGVETQRA
ncbi:putative trichohyalin [Gregarina niphandrodes]|uniref:Trichohyalin n=1 Tax=Gregarina niphandrodes TaxID=110365 RepID=A0A023BAE5_GRENI|nr:putative trichohyalin [Gregarina niphandrodes]EZG78170.1 putative trichohyalin [Gregarina niphandrodes]|eukprot:XP_011129435.1 putative trichohyalin [Gregarina niphandrodes]